MVVMKAVSLVELWVAYSADLMAAWTADQKALLKVEK
jgi:hypothetical protein